jgi:hypothetical protein
MQVRDNFLTFLFNRESLLAQCKELDVQYLVIPGMFAERSFIERAIKEELQVLVWDCENPVDQKNFIACGVSGLIVDKPADTKDNLAR